MSGTSPLASTQEEADARLLFHASHALIIHATDSDVMVIAIVESSVLRGCEIWMTAFGHRTEKRYIPCYLISKVLRSDFAWGLLLLRWFSGCDTVSTFRVISKKTAWTVWRSRLCLFARLSRAPCEVTSADMQMERIVVLSYH